MPAHDASAHDAVFRTIARRLLPLLFLCYIVAYLDRVNVGFAKLQMASALGLSDAVYGFGAGIFFIGYFLFEVPSNLALERFGAKRWIARIMISWGIISSAFAFVDWIPWGPLPALFGMPHHEFSFYALRFLLGIAEAGFFPGIILYLTYWFPSAHRARTVALFMTAIALANVVGAPLSGAIMQGLDGSSGWPGWRWLFVVEGVPSLFLGVALIALLPDGPAHAAWLTASDRQAVQDALDHDERMRTTAHTHARAGDAFRDARVWALAFVYLSGTLALYGVNFWMPTIIQELGVGTTEFFRIGLITAIPWGLAGIAMTVAGASSDRTGERRWHVAGSLLVTAAGLATLAVVGKATIPAIIALSLVSCGVLSFFATFWTLPTSFLTRSAAAAGIAWINSIGNLGGHFGPDLIGRIRAATQSASSAFLALAAAAAMGALLVFAVARRPVGRA